MTDTWAYSLGCTALLVFFSWDSQYSFLCSLTFCFLPTLFLLAKVANTSCWFLLSQVVVPFLLTIICNYSSLFFHYGWLFQHVHSSEAFSLGKASCAFLGVLLTHKPCSQASCQYFSHNRQISFMTAAINALLCFFFFFNMCGRNDTKQI